MQLTFHLESSIPYEEWGIHRKTTESLDEALAYLRSKNHKTPPNVRVQIKGHFLADHCWQPEQLLKICATFSTEKEPNWFILWRNTGRDCGFDSPSLEFCERTSDPELARKWYLAACEGGMEGYRVEHIGEFDGQYVQRELRLGQDEGELNMIFSKN